MSVSSVTCPHCGASTIVELPDGASGVQDVQASLRHPRRDTCKRCDQAFSYLTGQ